MSQISSNSLSSSVLSGSLRERLEAMPSLADASRLQSQRSFEQALGRTQGRAQGSDTTASTSKQDEARAAAEELVARALVQPIMAKLRESRDAAEPFGPNEVERAFGSISDAQFADRLTKSGNWSLVDAVAKRIMNAGKAAEPIATNESQQAAAESLAPLSIAAWAGVRKVAR